MAGYKLTVTIGVLRSLGFIVRMWRSGTHLVNRGVAPLSPNNVLVMTPGSKREAKEGVWRRKSMCRERKWALGTGDLLNGLSRDQAVGAGTASGWKQVITVL